MHEPEHLVRPVGHVVVQHRGVQHAVLGVQRDELREMRRRSGSDRSSCPAAPRPRTATSSERMEDLRHPHSPLLGRVERVRHAVALRLHAEVEAVEVHRVIDLGEIDHPPVDRVALRVAQPLRVRPGQPIDGHGAAAQVPTGSSAPPRTTRDREDAVVRLARRVRRVDDDDAVELHVLDQPKADRDPPRAWRSSSTFPAWSP